MIFLGPGGTVHEIPGLEVSTPGGACTAFRIDYCLPTYPFFEYRGESRVFFYFDEDLSLCLKILADLVALHKDPQGRNVYTYIGAVVL